MPSPKKGKSPSRARSRSKSKSSRVTRSRSRSLGRKSKSEKEVKEVKSQQTDVRQSRVSRRSASKSPSRTIKETVVTKTVVTSSQDDAGSTPVRSSARIASLIEKEREASSRLMEQMKSEMLTNIKTPPRENSEGDNRQKTTKKVSYEFMGPIGAFAMLFLLPATMYYINLACRKGKCSIFEVPNFPKKIVPAFFELEATGIFFAWMAFQAFLAVLPIGKVVEGQPLKSGGHLKYRCNGFFSLVVSLAVLLIAVYLKCPVIKVLDKFYKLMTTATLFSFALSICLYIKSRLVSEKKLAPGGNTGNIIYDFFIGRELNPRVGPLDLKFFCELRPGLIGWVMLCWLMVIKAYQTTGTFPPNLVLVTAFQTLYVADGLWFEEAILTTMDILHDGFGFMLVFGDLAWVPFLYCLQPRFLLETNFTLPWYCLAPIALLNLAGYTIFRLSNSQKNKFRNNPKDPNLAGLEAIPTQTGKKLLVGGWWGMCRKPNYLGDLMMAFAWSLTTGFGHLFPYYYPIYFLILLIHRERRDNEQCKKKYGASWDRYCERVKYRIFPYIY